MRTKILTAIFMVLWIAINQANAKQISDEDVERFASIELPEDDVDELLKLSKALWEELPWDGVDLSNSPRLRGYILAILADSVKNCEIPSKVIVAIAKNPRPTPANISKLIKALYSNDQKTGTLTCAIGAAGNGKAEVTNLLYEAMK